MKTKKEQIGTDLVNEVNNVNEVNETNEKVTKFITVAAPEEMNEENYSNLEWLQSNIPNFGAAEVTSKFNAEKEILLLKTIPIFTSTFKGLVNPLVIELGRWWEVKKARNIIKDMIVAEAKEQGIDDVFYMQNTLKEKITVMRKCMDVLQRFDAALTYYKPRAGKEKINYIKVKIDEVIYNVNSAWLSQAKSENMPKETMRAYIVENFNVISENLLEL